MSMKFRDKDGNETLIAGMGRSGDLVPSVSYYQTGTASFSDLTTQATEKVTVTLDTAMPDSDYVVVLNVANGVGYVVTSKSESAFTVRLQNLCTSTVSADSFSWQAFKLMTDASRALDEAQIEENTQNIASLTEGIPLQTPPSSDCNELIGITGKRVCYLNNNTITSNRPVATYGVLIVDRSGIRTYQKYVATSASGGYEEYTRMSTDNTSSSAWTAWVKTARENVTSGTATVANGATGVVTYYKSGRVCTLHTHNVRIPSSGDSDTPYFTGLPKAASTATEGFRFAVASADAQSTGFLQIRSDGTIGGDTGAYAITNGLYGDFTYITSD